VSRMVGNVDDASRSLPQTMREVDALVRDLRVISRDLAVVAGGLRATSEESMPVVRTAVQRLGVAADNVARTSERLDAFVTDNAVPLSTFTREGLPELERLVRDSRQTAVELQALSRSLREDPSRLLFQPAPRGVEVPR